MLRKQLAKELNVDTDDIPFNRKEFNYFIKEKIYKGFSKKAFEAKGFRVKINEKVEELAEEVFKKIEDHRKLKNRINEYSIESKSKIFPKHLLSQLKEFLEKVSTRLTNSFLHISNLEYLDKIKINYNYDNVLAISVDLILKNGSTCRPNQLLSEANLDLLALLFFLAFIQESAERGQAKLLILDDVLQSIDSIIRVNFISYLLKNFSDWQFIITAHDRLWQRQLIDLMHLYGHQYYNLSVVEWTFERGPKLTIGSSDIKESLNNAISSNDLIGICSQAGILLEQICDNLSISLSASIQRKSGDRYTLGDLSPSVFKLLKKTELKDDVESVEKWLHLRNLIGAHFNEWALALSHEEAIQFSKSVITLLSKIKCEKCLNWLSKNSNQNFYSCKCGNIIIKGK